MTNPATDREVDSVLPAGLGAASPRTSESTFDQASPQMDGHLRRAFLYGGEIEPSAPTEQASRSSPTSLPRTTGPEASRVGHHFRFVAHGAVMGSIAAPADRPFNQELAG